MRITRITSFLALCGIVLAFAGSSHTVRAAECVLSTPLANLQAIKNDDSLNDRDRLIKELTMRKQTLKDIVHCATKDAVSLKDGLVNATTSGNVAAHLQNQLTNQINDSLNYYNLKGNMIDNLGLQGTKDFANDLGAWRKDSELPLETNISTFLFWNQNQPIIVATQSRLTQITHAVASLDLSNNPEIAPVLLDAKNKLGSAIDLDIQTGIFMQDNNMKDAMSNITDSLDALKNAYRDFFSLSESVKHTFTK